MRIDRLDLIAFGPFTDAVLDLSKGAQGLHLIYGPNEAGKSSALRAIRQLFRGIPTQSTDNFVHKHTDMRIGAVLRDQAGAAFEIVRRKGAKNTLLGGDGKAIDDPDGWLSRMLGGVGPEEFLKKFVIDHAELVGGGKSVVEGEGDLGSVLFAAGSGLAGLSSVQKKLDEEAESLFKRGGSKPLINLKLAELDAARKRIKDDTLRSSTWLEHDAAFRAALERKDALERDLDAATRERQHLWNLSEALEPLSRRAAVLAELETLADVPRLSANFSYKRCEIESLLRPTERLASDAANKVRELTAELETIQVPDSLLAQAEAIKGLHLRLGSQQKARLDRDRLDADRERFQSQAGLILRDLGLEPEAAETGASGRLEPLRLKAPDRAAVLDLANERQARSQSRDDAANALHAVDARLQDVTARLDALGPGRDTSALRKTVKKVQKLGDLDALLVPEREALTRDRRKADVALKALAPWPVPLDALEALAVPPVETLERFQAEFDAAIAERDDLRRRVDEGQSEASQKAREIELLRLDGELPTEAALSAARADRDAFWGRLRRGWDDSLVPPFERAMRVADESADRLRREAKRVGDDARLRAESARLASALDDLGARHARALARLDEIHRRWSDLWQGVGVGINAPDTPREMIAWSRKAGDAAALARAVREKAEVVALREDQLSRHRRDVLDALSALGEPSPALDDPLADLLDRAQEVIEAVARESKARDRLKDELDALKSEQPARQEAAASARSAWDAWQGHWAAAMTRIGRSPDTLPAEANSVLALNADLFDRLDKADDCRRQAEAIARVAGQFCADVWTLADRVAPDLAVGKFDALTAEAAAAELADRLDRAQRARQTRDDRTARLAEAAADRDSARAEVARARVELAALRREARCETDDALPAVEERSSRRQALEADHAALTAALRKLAAGTPLDAFLDEAARADPSELAPRIARLDDRIGELARERETVNQTIGAERTHLNEMNGSSRAADAGQDAEDLRARIKADVEQYARLRLASAVLRAGIERYRDRSQGPVLGRASSLFSALTLGSFDGLAVAYDDRDEPVLKGTRPGPREPLGVSAMSLGTADQLYLSLRLATLETYLDRRAPLPFIVDDILMQFDNARTSATLSALAALSRRTQVLVFTHHEHLRDLAAKVVPPDVLFTHELPGPVALTAS